MTDILAGIGVATFVVYTAFHISYVLSLRRTSERMMDFLKDTESKLNGSLDELRATLENMKKITGNVSTVTEDVRQIADTVAAVERGMRGLYAALRGSFGEAAEANIAGLKAGIRTGVVTLVKNLREGRSDDHEGGDRKEGG